MNVSRANVALYYAVLLPSLVQSEAINKEIKTKFLSGISTISKSKKWNTSLRSLA